LSVELDGGPLQDLYLNTLARGLECERPVVGYYGMKDNFLRDATAEKGILLDRASVDTLVKRLLRNILNINILRSDGRLQTEKLTITVYHEGGPETIVITHDNIDDFQFDYFQKYVPANEEAVLENIRICREKEEDVKAIKKNKKDEPKQDKPKAKAAADTQD
jgi:hypothetical protein